MMLQRLIAFSLSQRLLVSLLTLAIAAGGVYAARGLPIDAFPDISSTQVKIIMKAPGMTPEEVEKRITAPIEQEVLGIPNQTIVRSKSKYAIADITIDFTDETDIYWARQQVSERLNNVLPSLPASASGGLAPISTPLSDVFMFTVEGPVSLEEKRTLLDWTIKPRLRSLAGVADVNSLGGFVKTLEVVPDVAALAARGLALGDLSAALAANNRSDGAGRLANNEEALLIRTSGDLRTAQDAAAIVIAERNGAAIRVGDVATVRTGALTRYGLVTQNGQGEAVEGLVISLRGANAQQVVESVRRELGEVEKLLPKGVTIRTFYDRGNLVSRAVMTVSEALLEATALVLVLLFLFLGNLRSALVVALILPLSALVTFIAMRASGLSANLMSLGGLAIAIGMLVDAAVVVVENIEAQAAHPQGGAPLPRLHRIYRAAGEVAVPVTAGIAVIVIVFAPLLSLQGLEGKLFRPVAWTIVYALIASLLLSLTAIPMLASWLLSDHAHAPPPLVRWIEPRFARLLEWVLGHSRVIYIAAGVAFVAAAGLFLTLGKSFMPTMDEGDVIVQLEKIPSISLAQSAAIDQVIEQRVMAAVPEVESIIARVGSDELGLDPMGTNETDSFFKLKPIETWRKHDKQWLIDELRKVGDDFAGINFSFTQPIDMRVSELISGVRGDLAIKIFGTNLDTLNDLATKIAARVDKIRGAEDVVASQNTGLQYLQITPDRLAIGRAGLQVDDVQDALRAMVEGRTIGQVIEEGRRLPLVLRGPDELRDSPQRFLQLRVPLHAGDAVPLGQLAKLERTEGPVRIERENSARMAVVRANVRNRDLVGFVEEAKAAVARDVPLPTGYRLAWGGQFENQQRTAARLAIVVPVALALIFLLLFVTLGSVRQALLVFVNIPFALIGGVFALAITREYLSVPASVGFIALMGIAVLNGLVLVSYFNQLRATGLGLREVVTRGAVRRLRPVLMTASITAFGLVPLLFATGPGSEIQRPLALVVIGGLLSSTSLTLILLPCLFLRFGAPRNP